MQFFFVNASANSRGVFLSLFAHLSFFRASGGLCFGIVEFLGIFKSFYVPPPWGVGVGDIVFSADPVGVGVATCLHSISLLNGQVLAKLTQIYHWEGGGGGGEMLIRFGYLDPIFKVT